MNFLIFCIMMEGFIRKWCEHLKLPFDEIIQKYNSNIKIGWYSMDHIINYKIKYNKDIIYKEDILKILGLSQEKFMEYVMNDAKRYNVNVNNVDVNKLTHNNCYIDYMLFYHLSIFLDNKPVDIKIALKD